MGSTDDQGREDGLGEPTAPVPQPPTPESPADEATAPVPQPPTPESPADEPAPPPADQQPWAPPTAPADPLHGSSSPPPGYGPGSPGEAPYDPGTPGPAGYAQGGYPQGGSGQDQPYPQYGQQPQGTGYPQYGQPGATDPGYGTPAPATPPGYPSPYQPAYGAAPAYAAPRQNTGALVLTIVSGATLLFCAGVLVIPALVLGIIGLTKQNDDPEGSRRMTRYGWWAYAAGVVVTIIAAIAFVGFLIAAASTDGYSGY